MTTALIALALLGAGVVALALTFWLGSRMLHAGGGSGTGMAAGLGGFAEVFDPAQGRADRERESRDHRREVLPSPSDEDPPVRVDLADGRVTIRLAEHDPEGSARR